MSTMNEGKLFLSVVAGLFLAQAGAAADLPQNSADAHLGVATCAASQCHGSAVPLEGSHVLQNEYVTWMQNDPHSKAYATLLNDDSRAMAARLGIGPAHAASLCLDCHADNVSPAKRGERFQLSDGVGCEACHGGAGRWLSTHYNTLAVTHQDNLEAGLYATDRVRDRARLCLSCHLGTQDKFASHRLMAAGHPRLSFELDTFTELWRRAGPQPHYRYDADYAERKSSPAHSYDWTIGLVAEARQRLALVLEPEFTGTGLFPELGLYDCHACHRTMKTVRWQRLPRHGEAGPGVPFLSDGALVMTLALVRAIDARQFPNLQAALARLHAAASTSSSELRAAAAALDDILQMIEPRLTRQAVQAAREKILGEILASAAAGNFLDYAVAEQAFMAVQMLAIELEDTALEAALDDLARSLENDERYSPAQFARLLSQHMAR